jgi:hypothetical protein
MPVRKIRFRSAQSRRAGQSGDAGGQMQKFAASKSHYVAPEAELAWNARNDVGFADDQSGL